MPANFGTTRCGYVAILGAPNAGKSTLLNALVGESLAIVTPKPQTTRGRIRGIATEGESQIVFVDTPGIFSAKAKFERAMVDAAWSAASEADAVLVVVDAARGIDDDTGAILDALKERNAAAVLVLNKVDKVDKAALPSLAQALYGRLDFARSFMVSASRGDGVADIRRYLAAKMPEGAWLFPEDETTDATEREIAAEITREQCFLRLHAELPYSLMVETEKWEEEEKNGTRILRIYQRILVERESQKKIVLGKGGAMLKAIGSASRRKIGAALGVEAHLFLFVKISETWKDEPESYKTQGLEYKR